MAVEFTSVKARVQWTDGASNGRRINNYTIQGKTSWTDEWVTLAENITAKVIDSWIFSMLYIEIIL